MSDPTLMYVKEGKNKVVRIDKCRLVFGLLQSVPLSWE